MIDLSKFQLSYDRSTNELLTFLIPSDIVQNMRSQEQVIFVPPPYRREQHIGSTAVLSREKEDGFWISTIRMYGDGRPFETLVFDLPLPSEIGLDQTKHPELTPFNMTNLSGENALKNHQEAVRVAVAALEKQNQ